MLLTSGAARLVSERGFGELLGVKVNRHRTQGIQSEEYLDDKLPGVTKIRVPHRGADWDEVEILDSRVEVASYFCDMLGEKHIGTALFKNSLGGRMPFTRRTPTCRPACWQPRPAALAARRPDLVERRTIQGAAGDSAARPLAAKKVRNQGQWLYSFCNLHGCPDHVHLRWQNAGDIRSIACLQKDGRWQRLKLSITNGNDGAVRRSFLKRI